jgi:hypothetical protein
MDQVGDAVTILNLQKDMRDKMSDQETSARM